MIVSGAALLVLPYLYLSGGGGGGGAEKKEAGASESKPYRMYWYR